MKFKEAVEQLNVAKECKKYGVSLWECPQFLFLIMGLLICAAAIFSFLLGTRYMEDPATVAFIVLLLSGLLLVLDFLIVRSFERLAQANRMKSEFVSIVSHQLRSPLSNLTWALEFLMSGKLKNGEQDRAEYFEILKENISRMNDLISDLLIVSRIQTATLPLSKQEFSLVELTQKLVKEFDSFAKASNVKITLEAEEDLFPACGDPKKTYLVLQNLLDNAVRYIVGKGLVKIRIKKQDKHLYFEIEDNGVGIPKHDQDFIFKKFFRSKNALSHRTQGSGLGLFIAKSIIQRSGGDIGFESEEGRGSTFWFTFPTITVPLP